MKQTLAIHRISLSFRCPLVASLLLVALAFLGGCSAGWSKVSAIGSTIRMHAMAYDPISKNVIAYGGTDSPSATATYAWNGSAWSQLSPATNPGPLISPAMALNTDTHSVMLFGGLNGQSETNKLWSWDGTNWTEVPPANSMSPVPGVRHLHAMAYDEKNHALVVFGGFDSGAPPPANEPMRPRKLLGDTWVWKAGLWKEMTPSSAAFPPPSPREAMSMAFDRATQQVILFGGTTDALVWNNETWAWDGTDWHPLPAMNPPTPRGLTTMACDGDPTAPMPTGNVYLFGGKIETAAGRTDYNNTYKWSGGDWAVVPPAKFLGISLPEPDARVNHAMAYDFNRGKMVLWAGENVTTVAGVKTANLLRDTWER